MNKEPEQMNDHNYDGISELDNQLPRWWVWLFNLTIVFGAIYLAYYHVVKVGPGQEEAHRRAVAAAQAALTPTVVTVTGENAVAVAEEPSTEDAVLATGKQLYTVNCAVCHGQGAEGLIGPNLCDDMWIHGPTFADTLHVIREGVLAKGMIAWKAVLKPADIQAVGSYIFTLRGSNPPNPKAPEGVKAGS